MTLVVLIVVGVLAVAASVVGVRWVRNLWAESAREMDVPDAVLEKAFLGGLLSGSMSATWPLVLLECFDWGIRLRGTGGYGGG